ncbi:diguanylate cyclase (GGDEF) domain-containing protein [Butyrivibrio sp. INlla18]|uniref:sensor domain-containing diguanylate cyclase n=1 Tax=Butyrivibrio sp. INlla18 TaxID=1520806 RepID=UPI000882C39C|nr:EAL domain-containing protein [Butyrivibrio sp. INlla18]SDA72546.1 diguanylate cyclase (GGDEF) domain-containing protein [Butyrivibrio sp. INlla18]
MTRYQYSDVERNLIENSLIPFGVFQRVGSKTVAIAITRGLCELFGFIDMQEAYAVFDKDVHTGCHPDDLERMTDMYRRLMIEKEVKTMYRKNVGGRYMVFRFHAVLIHKEEGVDLINAWFANEGPYIESDSSDTYTDVISKAVHERSQLYYFNHDFLTGLPNMSYFFELAAHGSKEMQREGDQPCMLYFDLCGMKGFNQKYSFAEGDKLLTECGRMLAKNFGRHNCGRFAGDHFCAYTSVTGLEKKLENLLNDVKELNEGRSLPMRIGVYIPFKDKVIPSIACDRAKMACDAVRNIYYSCISYFDEKMLKASEEKEYIVTHLDKALEKGWIKVFYQPMIRAANGKVSDEEALARWDDPKHGMILPSVFVPILEDARLIYKLDLYVAKKVIEKVKMQKEQGIFIGQQSINISRTDFYICDIVDELTKLVDEAKIPREILTIEITESAVGIDIDYMKTQVERFHELGYKVWMDDYGSGYSSPELLQEIHFDTIKLDMQFMKRFNDSDASKIIMTELIKMACALGIETVAEGVETVEQVEFLKEVGCTKLQGYHYSEPLSIERLFERFAKGMKIGFENPKESDYYSTIGKISLYDLHMSAEGDEELLTNYFDTLPMAIVEINEKSFWIVRSNKPYKQYFEKTFEGYDIGGVADIEIMRKRRGAAFCNALVQCAKDGKRIIIDERSASGAIMHILIRRVAINPVTGVKALIVAILGISEDTGVEALTYSYVAQALSSDYINLFYVDLDTEKYIEYGSGDVYDDLAIERHGNGFFENAREMAGLEIYEEDRDYFIEALTKENVEKALNTGGVFTMSYRINRGEEPIYVHMKIVRIKMKGNSIIVGISNINAQMKERQKIERIEEENRSYSRLVALSENYITIFVVDLENDHYIKVNGKKADNKKDEEVPEGEDFFNYFLSSRRGYVTLGDMEYVNSQFNKDNIVKRIVKDGVFTLKYRFVYEGEIKYALLKAVFVEEKGEKKLIVGITDDTDATIQRQQTEQMILKARNEANVDALTGVKNKNAYLNTEKQINAMIKDKRAPEFALIVLDINGLKEVNDNLGHQEGDKYIKRGCDIICKVFRNCPVYRVGGDEFIVISQGRSYHNIEKIMQVWERTNGENRQKDDVVIAAGMARYNGEKDVARVFEKADALMYENKKKLKEKEKCS